MAFDAALCCGSLHLFADTVTALREMARVMKPAAILAVFTFAAVRGGVLKFRRVQEWSLRDHGLHAFELSEMERLWLVKTSRTVKSTSPPGVSAY